MRSLSATLMTESFWAKEDGKSVLQANELAKTYSSIDSEERLEFTTDIRAIPPEEEVVICAITMWIAIQIISSIVLCLYTVELKFTAFDRSANRTILIKI